MVANAVLTAFRPQPLEHCKEIRLFEVASSTDFGVPATNGFLNLTFVEITLEWGAKLEALKVYKIEMRNYPHSRSLKGISNLAKIRGNQVVLEMAESFEIIRKVETEISFL